MIKLLSLNWKKKTILIMKNTQRFLNAAVNFQSTIVLDFFKWIVILKYTLWRFWYDSISDIFSSIPNLDIFQPARIKNYLVKLF